MVTYIIIKYKSVLSQFFNIDQTYSFANLLVVQLDIDWKFKTVRNRFLLSFRKKQSINII